MVRPAKDKVTMGYYKQIDGIWHKVCSGPSHEEPVYLPANEKYFYKGSGRKLRSKCRLCESWIRLGASPGYESGYISVDSAWPFFSEAAARCGLSELAKRAGIARETILHVIQRKNRNVQKRIVRAVLLELISMRRKRERSISNHARTFHQKRLMNPEMACSECGTHLDNFTDGCGACWDRKRNRERRSQAA